MLQVLRGPIVNQLGFLACWWLCAGFADWGGLAALVLILIHLALQPQRKPELSVLLLCGSLGMLADAMLMSQGWLAFGTSTMLPFWLVVLWVAFAATLNHSLVFLHKRIALASLLGAVFGPVSYWSGMQLGRLQFPHSTTSTMLLLGLVWAVLMPALVALALKQFQSIGVRR